MTNYVWGFAVVVVGMAIGLNMFILEGIRDDIIDLSRDNVAAQVKIRANEDAIAGHGKSLDTLRDVMMRFHVN